jgi:hypothetical protein
VPGSVEASFEDNLRALDGSGDERNVKRLIIAGADRRRALRDLFHMNMSRMSLLPGLDGYAHSLAVYSPVLDDVGGGGPAS